MAVDHKPQLSAACQVADISFSVPKLGSSDYIDVLIDICKTNSIRLLIPTIDTELLLLSQNIERFKEQGTDVLISSEDFISKCRNKREIHKFFKSRDIRVAKEYKKRDVKFPLFIKPIDGSGGADTMAIHDQEEILKRQLLDDNLMFLEYIDPKEYDEYTCDLYYDKNGSLKCIVPRKRIEVREGEVSKAITNRNGTVDFLKERLSQIDGVRGCLTMQLFKHKESNEFIGIEINPRFGGGYPLSYLAGANFPKWILEEYFLNAEISPQFDVWEDHLMMLRFDQEILIHNAKG